MRTAMSLLITTTALTMVACTASLGPAGVGGKKRSPHPPPGPHDVHLIFKGACPVDVFIPPERQCIEEGVQRKDCVDTKPDDVVQFLIVQAGATPPDPVLQFGLDFDPFKGTEPKIHKKQAGDVLKLKLDPRLLDDPTVPQKAFSFAVVSPDKSCKVVDPQIVVRR